NVENETDVAPETPAPETPAPKGVAPKDVTPKADDQSGVPVDTSVRLVVMQDESDGADPAKAVVDEVQSNVEPVSDENPKTSKAETESDPIDSGKDKAVVDAEVADSSDDESNPSGEMVADETDSSTTDTTNDDADVAEASDKPSPKETPSDEDTTDKDATEDASSMELDDEVPETKPQPFESVREEIATRLATEPARVALDKAVTEVSSIMRRYFSELAVHQSNVDVGVATEDDAPKRPDLPEIAKRLELSYGKTDGLVNRVSVNNTPVGASFGLGENFNQRGAPFATMMFGAQMQNGNVIPAQPLYAPVQTVDLEAQISYVTWKTNDVESYVPELDEVRDEVINVIRSKQARELARMAATKLAGQLQDTTKLDDIVPEDKTDNLHVDLGPFAWLDQVGFMQTTIGNVEQLDAVGDQFMEAVFTTEVGSATVAPNSPQTVYYVVVPTEFQPDVDELREQFSQPQQRFMALLLGSGDARDLMNGYFRAVDKRTGFEMALQP
ncbi:MAG: hypothetical protein AAF745_05310, partial [Planctomycetota bacterium]